VTRHLTTTLTALYATAALFLLHCATTSWHHGSWPYTCLFTAAAILLTTAITHQAWQRDELRAAHARAERLARPTDPTPAIEDAVRLELALACCERWWTSCGAEHDTAHCTRKDQTL
jgi:hypothetical protein